MIDQQITPEGTAAWVKARIGYLSGSRMADAMSFNKDGKSSAKREKLLYEILAMRLTDIAPDHYVTDAMQWGIDFEPQAKERYEVATGNLIEKAGFCLHPTIEYFGATPDGFLDLDGVIEFKCPTMPTHMKWILNGVVPAEYKPQMISEILCARRKWAEFVSYDPRMPERQQLFIRRFVPTAEEIAEIETAAKVFLAEVDAMFEKITAEAA